VAVAERAAARSGAWICFADEYGQTLRAHKATTRAPKDVTPVVTVTAKAPVRVSVAGQWCYRPGHRFARCPRRFDAYQPAVAVPARRSH
jgi:hypothetical protein